MKIPKIIFCSNCKKRIMPDKKQFEQFERMNIQGTIKLACGDPKCKGGYKIKPSK